MFGWEYGWCCWDKDFFPSLFLAAKCGLLQGGGAGSLVYLCWSVPGGVRSWRSEGKLTPPPIFHGQPWKCQRRDKNPTGNNYHGGKQGHEDSGSKETSTSLVCFKERKCICVWGGGGSWRHSNSQTDTQQSAHAWKKTLLLCESSLEIIWNIWLSSHEVLQEEGTL